MRVTDLDPEPFDQLPALNAGGKGEIEEIEIPFLRGWVDELPDELDAIVAAADLQALDLPGSGPPRLVGEAVAEKLVELGEKGVLPLPERTGVLLAGDLYTVPDLAKRGGLGDVTSVWQAFAKRFKWVAGVLGNHDLPPRDPFQPLDGDTIAVEKKLRVGGVAGIIGNPSRTNRQSAETFCEKIEQTLAEGAEIVVLHEGPDAEHEGKSLRGNPDIRATLEGSGERPLVVCGHSWWPVTLVAIGPIQVLKVDGRVVVLTRAEAG